MDVYELLIRTLTKIESLHLAWASYRWLSHIVTEWQLCFDKNIRCTVNYSVVFLCKAQWWFVLWTAPEELRYRCIQIRGAACTEPRFSKCSSYIVRYSTEKSFNSICAVNNKYNICEHEDTFFPTVLHFTIRVWLHWAPWNQHGKFIFMYTAFMKTKLIYVAMQITEKMFN